MAIVSPTTATQRDPAGRALPMATEGDAVPERRAEDLTLIVDHVLDDEALRMERSIAVGGVVMTGVGFLMTLYATAVSSAAFGVPLSIFSGASVTWFLTVRWLLNTPERWSWLRLVTPFVELFIPIIATLLLVMVEGRIYALASWVPPYLFSFTVMLSALRLRLWMPMLTALTSAVLFALIALVVAPMIDPTPLPDNEVFSTRMQVARCLNLLFSGVVGMMVSWLLRSGFGRGVRAVRQQDLFGKYRLGEAIAAGGMGEVIKATYCPEGGFERPVAIKRLHPHLTQKPRFLDAFRREAELGARLLHPNIVQTVDFGRVDDQYFLAMEFVDGADLGELRDRANVHRHPFPAALVASIGLQIAEALHFAHAVAQDSSGRPLRIIHRDLSARNILISRSGQVKVTDFGIARALRDSQEAESAQLMGSLAYLSPEQAKGEPHDHRADLFALGILLFEMLTGRRLFQKSSDLATLRAVIEGPIPDVFTLRGGLARHPDDRVPTAQALAQMLAGQLDREGRPAPDALGKLVRDLLALSPVGTPPPPGSFEPNDVDDDIYNAPTEELRGQH
jgi:serine/threonine protein kinase